MDARGFWGRTPEFISHGLGRGTAQVCIRSNHALKKLFHAIRHFPGSNPGPLKGALPIVFQVLFSCELLAITSFERSAPDEDLEEGNTKRPDVGFSRVMRESACAFGSKILNRRCYSKPETVSDGSHTSGVPYERLLWKAVGESLSYFSAKPKSTRTGMFLCDSSIFAGL